MLPKLFFFHSTLILWLPGGTFLKDAKKEFVKQLVKDRGLDKKEAKKIAEKGMGVTWDVGHINQLRKYGYTKEDVIKETKKIAKEVKHLHITDNFGYSDSHLAPGMGNVPISEQLREIEKAKGKEEFEKMRKVVEGGGMCQHYQTSLCLEQDTQQGPATLRGRIAETIRRGKIQCG